MAVTKNIIRSVWTYTVNGQHQGTCTEQQARGMYELLVRNGNTAATLVRMDHVASDFAKTGRNWDVVSVIVDGPATTEQDRSTGELAADAAFLATSLADPYAESVRATPYYNDAAYLLLGLFDAAQQQGKLAQANVAFHKLAEADPYRVHKLLISLKRGRQVAVLEALLTF